jgi:hypothetical protein
MERSEKIPNYNSSTETFEQLTWAEKTDLDWRAILTTEQYDMARDSTGVVAIQAEYLDECEKP